MGVKGGDVMVWCDVLSVRGCTESKFDVCQKNERYSIILNDKLLYLCQNDCKSEKII